MSWTSPENVWKPQIWPVSLSESSTKKRKWTERVHNLICSEGGQDTSACNISGHSLHAFCSKCLETPNLTRFTKSKWCQKYPVSLGVYRHCKTYRSSIDKQVGGPVKNVGEPVKLCYIIMFKIVENSKKCIFVPVKHEKFSRCLSLWKIHLINQI